MTKVAENRTLLREGPDGFALITGIIATEQIDFLSRESIFRESSNHQCLISRGKTSRDDQRVILLKNGRFRFFKCVALQGFFGSKHGFKSNISPLIAHPFSWLITIHFCSTSLQYFCRVSVHLYRAFAYQNRFSTTRSAAQHNRSSAHCTAYRQAA